jgi:hypothetical protein
VTIVTPSGCRTSRAGCAFRYRLAGNPPSTLRDIAEVKPSRCRDGRPTDVGKIVIIEGAVLEYSEDKGHFEQTAPEKGAGYAPIEPRPGEPASPSS